MNSIGLTDSPSVERRIGELGRRLAQRLSELAGAVPGADRGPVQLARVLGIDKVLASRVLKAVGRPDPIAALHGMPGPAPLRRFARAAGKRGVPRELVYEAERVIDEFDELIRREAGDRSALDAMLSAWLPESRAEFELRRKQAAFRAMSQLRGVEAELMLSSALLHPAADGAHMDLVWIVGLLGIQRLRPGARIKFTSKRLAPADAPRRPLTLDGTPVSDLNHLRLDAFCTAAPAQLEVRTVGQVVHYTVANDGFGPSATRDLLVAEVNRADLPQPDRAPAGRKCHVYAGVSTPTKLLVFDALLHESLFRGVDPQLHIYDTAFEGIADVNDPTRDIDRLDLNETVQSLGSGIAGTRTAEAPRYAEMIQHVCDRMGWDGARLRGYRCRIAYPVYGTQVTMAWPA